MTTGDPTTWTDLAADADAAPWPTAALAPCARLRALAAGLPGAVVEERVIDAPFAEVWGFIADLERSVPTFDADVRALRVVERRGTRLVARAQSSWRVGRVPLSFAVDLEPGWCWMVARPHLYVVGMAAEPDPDDPGRTRYAHLEGIALRHRLLAPVARLTRSHTRRHVRGDVAGITREVTGRG
jgi:hypothetical protein